MNALANTGVPPKFARMQALINTARVNAQVTESAFRVYLLYVMSYFLHIPERLPSALASLRPDLLIAITIFALLFTQKDKLNGRATNTTLKVLIAFTIYIVVTFFLVEWPGSVVNNLPKYVKSLVFVFFSALILDSIPRIKTFVFVYLACQTVRVIEPLILNVTTGYWGSKTWLGTEYMARLSGAPADHVNPNGLALVIITIWPFLHFLLGSHRRFSFRLLYWLLAPMLLYTLILTASRSGFIAFCVVALGIFLKSNKKPVLLVVGALMAVVAVNNMTQEQKERYLSITQDDVRGAETSQGRIDGMAHDFEVAMIRPVVGHGIGTSLEAIFHARGRAQVSHTIYTEVIIETGLIGLIFFVTFLVSIYRNLQAAHTYLKTYLSGQTGNALYFRRWLFSMQVCFWSYLVFSVAYFGLTAYYWYVLAGMAVLALRFLTLLDKSPAPVAPLQDKTVHVLNRPDAYAGMAP